MWWTDSTSKHSRVARAAAPEAPGNDRLFSILGTNDEDDEPDRSRPVPWDYPDEPRRTLS